MDLTAVRQRRRAGASEQVMAAMRGWIGLVALAVGCGGRAPRERFESSVVPVLERRCAAATCHGVAPGAQAAGDVIDPTRFFLALDARGRLADVAAAYANAKLRINTVERPEYSTLLRKPLGIDVGGLPHEGGHFAATRDDPDWRALRDWVVAESGGGEGASPDTLTPLQEQFASDVQPVLRDRGCMVSRCHGPLVMFGGLSFQTPIDGSGGGFSTAQTVANYTAARHNLALTGDGTRSRLLVKALPLDAGGVIHRGGNDLFFPHDGRSNPRDAPGPHAIAAWAAAERAAAVPGPSEPAGVVFVRGPIAPHRFLELDAFRPGSDVWFYPSLASGAKAVNLTAAVHGGGPADIRDPAVSHDGKRIAFAMRLSEDDCHNLYEIGLDGSGAAPAHLRPRHAPGGRQAREPLADLRSGRATLLRFDTRGCARRDRARARQRPLHAGARPFRSAAHLDPDARAVADLPGHRRVPRHAGLHGGPAPNGFDASMFRFPPDRAPEHPQADYHPHFGQTAPGEVTFGLRELPDGRDVAVLFDHDARLGGRRARRDRAPARARTWRRRAGPRSRCPASGTR